MHTRPSCEISGPFTGTPLVFFEDGSRGGEFAKTCHLEVYLEDLRGTPRNSDGSLRRSAEVRVFSCFLGISAELRGDRAKTYFELALLGTSMTEVLQKNCLKDIHGAPRSSAEKTSVELRAARAYVLGITSRSSAKLREELRGAPRGYAKSAEHLRKCSYRRALLRELRGGQRRQSASQSEIQSVNCSAQLNQSVQFSQFSSVQFSSVQTDVFTMSQFSQFSSVSSIALDMRRVQRWGSAELRAVPQRSPRTGEQGTAQGGRPGNWTAEPEQKRCTGEQGTERGVGTQTKNMKLRAHGTLCIVNHIIVRTREPLCAGGGSHPLHDVPHAVRRPLRALQQAVRHRAAIAFVEESTKNRGIICVGAKQTQGPAECTDSIGVPGSFRNGSCLCTNSALHCVTHFL
eukprot:gene8692-biopygen8444